MVEIGTSFKETAHTIVADSVSVLERKVLKRKTIFLKKEFRFMSYVNIIYS